MEIWSNQSKETNTTENIFFPQNEPLTAKLSLSGVLKHFCRKLTKNFSLRSKNYLRKKIRITQKVIFSNEFERDKS